MFGSNKPYVTQHMSAKDRNEYNQFVKGKNERPQNPHQQLLIPPPPFINFGGNPQYGIPQPMPPYLMMPGPNKFQQG